MAVYTQSGQITIPNNIRALKIILKGEGGAGSNVYYYGGGYSFPCPPPQNPYPGQVYPCGACSNRLNEPGCGQAACSHSTVYRSFVGNGGPTTFINISAGGGNGGYGVVGCSQHINAPCCGSGAKTTAACNAAYCFRNNANNVDGGGAGGSATASGGAGGTITNNSIITPDIQINGNDGVCGSTSVAIGGIGPGGNGTNGGSSLKTNNGPNVPAGACGCSSSGSYTGYDGCSGGAGAYVESTIYESQLNALNILGTTQSFTVNEGGSSLDNGSLEIIFLFGDVYIKTSLGWQLVKNIYVNQSEVGIGWTTAIASPIQ